MGNGDTEQHSINELVFKVQNSKFYNSKFWYPYIFSSLIVSKLKFILLINNGKAI